MGGRKTLIGARSTPRTAGAGYTLMELLAVILIVLVLVGIAIPVYTLTTSGAEQRAAEANSRIGDSMLAEAWTDIAPEGGGAYLDYSPPPGLSAPSLVDASYMSHLERRVNWADLRVVDGRLGVYGIYRNGKRVAGGPGFDPHDRSNLYGRVGVLQNYYWSDGAWRLNDSLEYATVITLARSGRAFYGTYRQGDLVDSGSFIWKNGRGHPGG